MQNNCSEGNGRQRKCPGGLSHFKLNSKEQMNGECKGRGGREREERERKGRKMCGMKRKVVIKMSE